MDENWTLMKDGQSDTINRGDWLAANLKSGKNTVKDTKTLHFSAIKTMVVQVVEFSSGGYTIRKIFA